MLVTFALPRNTAVEASAPVLNLSLLQYAPFPTVQGKVKSHLIYSTNEVSTMSETLFQVLRMYQRKTHQTCILVETSNIDTYFLSALRKNKAGLRCEDRKYSQTWEVREDLSRQVTLEQWPALNEGGKHIDTGRG